MDRRVDNAESAGEGQGQRMLAGRMGRASRTTARNWDIQLNLNIMARKMPPERERQVREMASYLKPILRRSVTPIASNGGGKLAQRGTGTLFRIADESFLVTAGHVWKSIKPLIDSATVAIFAGVGEDAMGQQLRMVPLIAKIIWADDPFDIAVLALDECVVRQFDDSCFLRMTDVSLSLDKNGRHWVYGFPSEYVTHDGMTGSCRFDEFLLSTSLHNQEVAAENVYPDFHFFTHIEEMNRGRCTRVKSQRLLTCRIALEE